ncbi:P-loop containing nucleoside triphosphate hydrolase protein [Epithele typhae]|uniref:P-loop containing nucleoside triphosphate hydrolase protein n=1 Tax=Epithele typhae TaxID=378194 RepID=UPI0020078E7E|nr:P-loop containing nucleoside triphosphate hydrolase protein [Epithele typhae]KAH9944308.1 P-loop containing nucleoside triphosphate hydrolase protein [Epithele typhae]
MPQPWCCLLSASRITRCYSSSAHAVTLRPYQETCLNACLAALKTGSSRIGVSLPTGSGKTTVFISLLGKLPPLHNASRAARSLVIVNSVELAQQTADQASRLFPEWSVEIEQGKQHASGLADVTVATVQTLLRGQRLEKFHPEFIKAVIVDEAHHAAAPSYRRILSHFHSDVENPDESEHSTSSVKHRIPIFGFSATFSRHDGLALGSVFEEIVYHRGFLDMIKEQWLCGVRFTTVHAKMDLSNVSISSRSGDFQATSLAHVVNTDTVNELIVRTWLDKASDRKSTLVFCVNVEHILRLASTFRSAGVDARYVHAGTPPLERRQLVQAFRNGEFPVMINCNVLTEGTDVPNIDCVMVARPTRSRNLFAQMIGRGMRLSPFTGKEDCRIIDFVDSQNRVSGVISTPTLFGLDPNHIDDLNDETIESLERRSAEHCDSSRSEELGPSLHSVSGTVLPPKSVVYVDHEDPFAREDNSSGDPHINAITPFAWVCCGAGIYILECLEKGFIKIVKVESEDDRQPPKWQAHYTPPTLKNFVSFKLKISPYGRQQKLLDATDFIEAVRGSDTFAKKLIDSGREAGLLRTAKWRSQPATPNQLQLVRKKWKGRKVVEAAHRPDFKTLTKGQAANIITRLKHGALRRYEDKLRRQAKLLQGHQQEQTRRAREEVRVGPLSA